MTQKYTNKSTRIALDTGRGSAVLRKAVYDIRMRRGFVEYNKPFEVIVSSPISGLCPSFAGTKLILESI